MNPPPDNENDVMLGAFTDDELSDSENKTILGNIIQQKQKAQNQDQICAVQMRL